MNHRGSPASAILRHETLADRVTRGHGSCVAVNLVGRGGAFDPELAAMTMLHLPFRAVEMSNLGILSRSS